MPEGEHLNEAGEFVSDRYHVINPYTGERVPNVVPVKISARTASPLWVIARRYEGDRPVFAADVKQAITNANKYFPRPGHVPGGRVLWDQHASHEEKYDMHSTVEGEVSGSTVDSTPRKIEFVGGRDMPMELNGLFNTFRIGRKWLDALPFEELTLVVVESGTDEPGVALHGSAVVLSVHHGTLGYMLDLHLGVNHAGQRHSVPAIGREELRGILSRAYDRHLADDEECVVLYLVRVV